MSSSQFCIQQRQKEQQQLKKLLVFGFAGSAVLHGILAYALPRWSLESPRQVKEPIEMMIVNKPKPISKPKPKVEPKPIVEPKPKPLPKPEPVKAQTPPPKPVPQAPAPTPAPKKVLTTPTPAPSQPIISVPINNTAQPSLLSNSLTVPISSSVTKGEISSNNPGVPGSAVATNSAPPRPESNSEPKEGISCVSNCAPEYPAVLEGVEGRAGVKLTIDQDGNVIGVELADADDNSQVNRQALLAARQMQFSSPGKDATSVQVKIDFTVEGSEYDRLAREEQEKKEQAERERKEQQAAARQQQLEAERQARQEQMERERQARQEKLSSPSESTPPEVDSKPAPKPLPTPSLEELEAERLRKFRERIENY